MILDAGYSMLDKKMKNSVVYPVSRDKNPASGQILGLNNLQKFDIISVF
jgi:hypothetical protein